MFGIDAAKIDGAVLKKGVLMIPGFTMDEYWQLEEELRLGLLDRKIMYSMPVSIYWTGAPADLNYISKSHGMLDNLAEIMTACQNLIYCSSGTKPKAMQVTGYGAVCSSSKEIRTNNGSLYYEGKPGVPAKSLIKDAPVVSFQKAGVVTSFLLREGTGVFDFKEVQTDLRQQSKYRYPIRAVYDLTSVLTVRRQDVNDKIVLHYKKDIYEDVLLEIIKQFVEMGGYKA